MYFVPRQQNERIPNLFLKSLDTFDNFDCFRVVGEPVEHVGCGHHVRDAVLTGNSSHIKRLFETSRTVVQLRKNVGMNVDQLSITDPTS